MSMTAHFRVVEPSMQDSLAAYDDEQMAAFLFPDDESSDTTKDIDKAWDAINHLLSIATDGSLPTLLSGAEVSPDLGYGRARFMTSEEVVQAAEKLKQVDRSALLAHFDAPTLMRNEVYPEAWEDTHEDRDYIGRHYETARHLFIEAARDHSAVLVWLA